ncbi:MAG: hypothetical protein ACD_28C00032G0008 [uncultured bacterium]|nr:MAG: hypothetical protein ACD_28C00032G0008 [uncultured bacterium]KKT74910.1 MAG: hypothetical protein UW70_C0043G0003 [Candidatus Peregrinibacteria bacterium GW2011_GWA2_44_7]
MLEPIYLRIKVIPKSSKSEIVETMGDGTLKIRIAAPPEKGKANTELIRFLSRHLKIDKSQVNIISGKSDTLKLIKIHES